MAIQAQEAHHNCRIRFDSCGVVRLSGSRRYRVLPWVSLRRGQYLRSFRLIGTDNALALGIGSFNLCLITKKPSSMVSIYVAMVSVARKFGLICVTYLRRFIPTDCDRHTDCYCHNGQRVTRAISRWISSY